MKRKSKYLKVLILFLPLGFLIAAMIESFNYASKVDSDRDKYSVNGKPFDVGSFWSLFWKRLKNKFI